MPHEQLFLKNFIDERYLSHPIGFPGASPLSESLMIEIGIGNGEYIAGAAKRSPSHKFIGIDYQWPSVKRSLKKISQARLSNVSIFKSEARTILERFVFEKSADHIYSLFPCPWPKRRNQKNRLFNRDFIKLVNSRLKDSGSFTMLTDHHEFFLWTKNESMDTGFDISGKQLPTEGCTRYARKWIQEGVKKFYELKLKKNFHIEYPLKEKKVMKSYRVDTFDPDRFHPENITGSISVIFKEWLYDASMQKCLVRVIVSEEGFAQHLWISISRDENSWKIKPSEGSAMIPTPGIQSALDRVYETVIREKKLQKAT